jgi:hypothetical protein
VYKFDRKLFAGNCLAAKEVFLLSRFPSAAEMISGILPASGG